MGLIDLEVVIQINTHDALSVAQTCPPKQQQQRVAIRYARRPNPRKAEQVPLQIRLRGDEVRAIKVAAAEHEQTISKFMLEVGKVG